jgi:ribosomal-protein-alanine N-acetyltransferase
MTILETERLALRHLTADDAAFVVALLNDPDFLTNIGDRGVRTADDAVAYLARGPQASYAQHGFGLFAVTLLATGEPIGICGLLKRDALEDVDLGFAFLPAFRAQGYAREAAAATMAWGLRTLRLPRLVAIVQPGNDRSIRLLERLGFTHERTVRVGDDGVELMLFAAGAEAPA